MLIHESPRAERRSWRGTITIIAIVITTAGAGAVLTAPWAIPVVREAVYAGANNRGYHQQLAETDRLRTEIPVAATRWGRSWLAGTDIPHLTIDIDFRNFEALRARRAEAVARGILIQGEDDLVPATIRLRNRSVRVRLRLKGDLVSGQFSLDSWSFRIHTRGDDHILGMRRFSLHHPRARGYHTERLFLEHVRSAGVLAPRYHFVRVSINGDDHGVMAVEEHFSKELIESQGRREGVILKIDEGRFWTADDREGRHASPLGHFRAADLVPFRPATVARDSTLQRQLQAATGLYRGFVERTLAPSEVFDPVLMGRFLAVVDTWSAWHAASWRNVRFYYNPITAWLEPIAYDAELILVSDAPPESLHAMLLDDPVIRSEYRRALEGIASGQPKLLPTERLEETQRLVLHQLHRSFPFLTEWDIQGLAAAAERALTSDPLARVHVDPSDHWGDSLAAPNSIVAHLRTLDPEQVTRLWLLPQGEGSMLEVASLVPEPVHIRVPGMDEPIRVPGTSLGTTPVLERIALTERPDSVMVHYMDRSAWIAPLPYASARATRPTLEPSMQAIDEHSFFRLDPETQTVSTTPGVWDVSGSISLPDGVSLHVTQGTTLRFQKDAILLVRGPTRFLGADEAPIVLEGSGASGWGGVVVFGRGSSAIWSHVDVRGTTGVSREGWTLTGGVTLVEGDVDISSSRITGNRAEDALNLVSTSFTLSDLVVADAQSDGVDIDFGSGTIVGGRFIDVGWVGGGDAIDFSGADVTLEGTVFERIGDKAVSIGERSTARIVDITVAGAGVGIAGKDGSYVEVHGSDLSGVQWASLMAYIKKPEFGGAVVEAFSPVLADGPGQVMSQISSLLRIDGVTERARPINVDSLYATTMRPGLRR